VKAIVFDFDGLIVDTEIAVYESWRAAWAERGIELTKQEWSHCIGAVGTFDPISELEQRSGWPFTDEEAQRRRDRRDEILAAEPIRPGIVEHLDAAHAQGIKTAIASSSSHEWVSGNLAALHLTARFSHLVCYESDGLLLAKPAPDLYQAALAHLGAEPHAAIAYEDSPHGVTAAKAAGLRCVAVPNGLVRHFDFTHADLVVDSLADITLEEVLAALSPLV
jgi:HAD superfamily hydrolase (TIGR01509 family)